MHLTHLAAENFRPFASLAFEPHPRRNLIVGANAAGKTSVLEALYTLGRGHSFRGSAAEVAGRAGAHWKVSGTTAEPGEAASKLAIGWAGASRRVSFNGKPATLQELVEQLPVQILEPESHRLVEDGPLYRRRYLDWGVFHVEHKFFPAWQRYQRALRQRNSALRAALPRAEVETWNAELAAAGTEIDQWRRGHLARLGPRFNAEAQRLMSAGPWHIELDPGWAEGASLSQSLADSYVRDAKAGTTLAGPHRAELQLTLASAPARHRVSRGQQKMAVAALLLAQARLIAEAAGREPLLLVDDVSAELDRDFQEALGQALADYPGQVFATAIEPPAARVWRENLSVFHVEHGALGPALRV